mmetsp:Transcript_36085/g.70118  ORF Transcript_36085/g.70118 Transcript_36085/m.70118 type:complete len:408 (-) Transcript_36085:100-1323(-)
MHRLRFLRRGAAAAAVAAATTAAAAASFGRNPPRADRKDNSASSKSWPTGKDGGSVVMRGDELMEVEASLNYQDAEKVAPSLVRNGLVGTERNSSGGDMELYGVHFQPTMTTIKNARAMEPTRLSREGFELRSHDVATELGTDFDFYDDNQIIQRYYPSIEKLVREATGASHVYAFDHNVRCAGGNKSGKTLKSGSAVQAPAHIVHTDYTLTSAPQRLRDLSEAPKINDTWRKIRNTNEPLIPKEQVKDALEGKGRFQIINVWRNIKKEPVGIFPLAVCNAHTANPKDLVTFEIHYKDRVGENYFLRAASAEEEPHHRWYYFPRMMQSEVLVFKQWDTHGPLPTENRVKGSGRAPQFCAHTAFKDPSSLPHSPDRESIEVRVIALHLDDEKEGGVLKGLRAWLNNYL